MITMSWSMFITWGMSVCGEAAFLYTNKSTTDYLNIEDDNFIIKALRREQSTIQFYERIAKNKITK